MKYYSLFTEFEFGKFKHEIFFVRHEVINALGNLTYWGESWGFFSLSVEAKKVLIEKYKKLEDTQIEIPKDDTDGDFIKLQPLWQDYIKALHEGPATQEERAFELQHERNISFREAIVIVRQQDDKAEEDA